MTSSAVAPTCCSPFHRYVRPIAIISVIAMTLLTSCVERYHPNEMYLRPGVLVINAHLTDKPGVQIIEVSRSAHIESPGFHPELDCYLHLAKGGWREP